MKKPIFFLTHPNWHFQNGGETETGDPEGAEPSTDPVEDDFSEDSDAG